MSRKRVLSALLAAVVSTGCAIGPDYSRPAVDLPVTYREPIPSGVEIANLPWWEFFADNELRTLIRIALDENKNLQIAAARVDQARAILNFTRADQFPRIDLAGQTSRSDSSDEIISFTTRPRNDFGIFGDLSFELDIWGKLRRATEAQRAQLLATEYGRRAVIVSLIAQVATAYFEILTADDQIAISDHTLKNRHQATKIITARFQKGMIPELDVNQAQIEESNAGVTRKALERQRRIAENALSVLLGRPPAAISRGLVLKQQTFRDEIPAGFPAVLLERRPDVLASEEQVKAAVAKIGVAKAEQLPSFDLLGFVGLQSSDVTNLMRQNAFTWSIGGGMVGPLLDWGKSGSQVDLAEAVAHEAFEQYQQTVLQAVQEVEDSLISIRTYREEHELRGAEVRASRNAAKLSRARYDEGVTSYLEVLDVERSLFSAELGEAEAFQGYLSSIVKLYKSLGGGWIEEVPAA